jgi:hypothetical protein
MASTALAKITIVGEQRGWVVREIRAVEDFLYVEVTLRRARRERQGGHYDTLRILVPYVDAPKIGEQARLDLFRDEG